MKTPAIILAAALTTGCTATTGVTTIDAIEIRANGGTIRAEGIRIQKDRAAEIARGIAEGLATAATKSIKPF